MLTAVALLAASTLTFPLGLTCLVSTAVHVPFPGRPSSHTSKLVGSFSER